MDSSDSACARLDEVDLDPPTSEHPTGPTISHDTTLHYALSLMLAEGTTRIDVVDDDSRPVGSVRMDAITEADRAALTVRDAAPAHQRLRPRGARVVNLVLAAGGPVIPTFGHASKLHHREQAVLRDLVLRQLQLPVRAASDRAHRADRDRRRRRDGDRVHRRDPRLQAELVRGSVHARQRVPVHDPQPRAVRVARPDHRDQPVHRRDRRSCRTRCSSCSATP